MLTNVLKTEDDLLAIMLTISFDSGLYATVQYDYTSHLL